MPLADRSALPTNRVAAASSAGAGGVARAQSAGSGYRLSRRAVSNEVIAAQARAIAYKARPAPYLAAKAVGAMVPKITRKAMEKFGFSAASLITDWTQIVGRELARDTLPERLKWPRGVDAYGEVEAGGVGRPGATLILRVDPARALDVQYRSAQILSRINSYFGYRAVDSLRLVQGAVEAKGPAGANGPGSGQGFGRSAAPVAAQVIAPANADLANIGDEGLRAALTKLAAGVARRNAQG